MLWWTSCLELVRDEFCSGKVNTPHDLQISVYTARASCVSMSVAVTKVGASGISADVIPYWMVQVLVLGQPTGYVCIPNRHLEGTAVPPAESGSGVAVKDPAETGKREAEDTEEGLASTDSGLRTLGDLRAHIGDKLDLATDEVELWIADPEDRSSDTFSSTRGDGNLKGHTGHGNSPAHPRGDKALIDDMDLRYYGLHHLSVVDVRIKPKARENGSSGSEAAGTEGGGAGEKNKEGQGHIVRIGVKTSHMMARGEEGTVRLYLLVLLVSEYIDFVGVRFLGERVSTLQQSMSHQTLRCNRRSGVSENIT